MPIGHHHIEQNQLSTEDIHHYWFGVGTVCSDLYQLVRCIQDLSYDQLHAIVAYQVGLCCYSVDHRGGTYHHQPTGMSLLGV